VDKSDLLTLRSVDENLQENQSLHEKVEAKEAEVGGIINIPGFSSSEEKLLEYTNYQSGIIPSISSTTAEDGLLFQDDSDDLAPGDVTDKYESITAGIDDLEASNHEEDQNVSKSPRSHHPRIGMY
jgi:hypothetical protein